MGLAKGPKPGYKVGIDDIAICNYCMNNQNLRLLTWDDHVDTLSRRLTRAYERLQTELNSRKITTSSSASVFDEALESLKKLQIAGTSFDPSVHVYGIRSAKGLEFKEVAIVDIFHCSKTKDEVESFSVDGSNSVG